MGSWFAGKCVVGHTATEARKGKPGHGLCRSLSGVLEGGNRKAGKYCERESPPHALGESYQA
jgi:hypothetical protein